jgi:hypothetical protein
LQRSGKISEFRIHASLAHSSEALATVRTAGFLDAAGDSWFDYPLHDVLKVLDDDHAKSSQMS